MVVKLLVTNKRYFFQENPHHILQMLHVCVHAWSKKQICLSTMSTQKFIPFSFYFVLPFTSLPFCFYCVPLASPSFYLFYNCQSFFLQMIKCILLYFIMFLLFVDLVLGLVLNFDLTCKLVFDLMMNLVLNFDLVC
jgi:hypothetical protein